MARYGIYRQSKDGTKLFHLVKENDCMGTACEIARLLSMSPNILYTMIVNVYDRKNACVVASYKEGFTHTF